MSSSYGIRFGLDDITFVFIIKIALKIKSKSLQVYVQNHKNKRYELNLKEVIFPNQKKKRTQQVFEPIHLYDFPLWISNPLQLLNNQFKQTFEPYIAICIISFINSCLVISFVNLLYSNFVQISFSLFRTNKFTGFVIMNKPKRKALHQNINQIRGEKKQIHPHKNSYVSLINQK